MVRLPLALTLLVAGWATGAAAQAIPCGEPYAVRRGDTLMRIARRAYGSDDGLATLIAANAGAFARRDPSLIEVGELLAIPCPGSTAAAAPVAAPAAEPDAADATPGAAVPEAVLATAPASAPAAVETAPVLAPAPPPAEAPPAEAAAIEAAPAPPQGPAPDRAQEAPTPPPPPRMVRLDGPSAALAAPLVTQALTARLGADDFVIEPGADGSAVFALVRPDCPPPASDARCAARWSAPLLEQALVFHTRRDASAPITPDNLRQCRTATVASADAAMQADAAGCLRAVVEGRADIAVATAPEADAALRALPLDMAALLAEQPALTARVALRAMADPGDAAAVALIAALDEGMAALRAQGAWFGVVDAALRATE